MKTKYLLCIALLSGLAACSSTPKYANDNIAEAPTYRLKNYNGPEAMSNEEVTQASKQCIFAKMKPNVHYLSVKTDQGRVSVPVNVTCEYY
jgi:hypothetical protein